MIMRETLKAKKYLSLFLISNFVGLCVALYTLWHHVAINNDALNGATFCNINSYINCDAVALSKYSAIMGYPVAGLLVIFYALLMTLGLSLYNLQGKALDSNKSYALAGSLFALSTFALIPTFLLAYLSVFELKLLCLLCVTSYVVNLVIWILSLLIKKSQNAPHFSLPPRASWTLLVIVSGVFALSPVIFKGLIGGTKIEPALLNTVLQQHFTNTQNPITTMGVPSLGPETASIVVVEYSDFQCPHCARASSVVPQVVLAHSDVRFLFKNFPLDPNCNPTMQNRGHPLSCLAAKAGHCVFKQKGSQSFFNFEKLIFANQSTLSSDFIYQTGEAHSGLSQEDLKTCMNSPETHQFIVDQVNEGVAAGVAGTPSLYVNGKRLEYGTVASVLKAAILKYKEASSNAGK